MYALTLEQFLELEKPTLYSRYHQQIVDGLVHTHETPNLEIARCFADKFFLAASLSTNAGIDAESSYGRDLILDELHRDARGNGSGTLNHPLSFEYHAVTDVDPSTTTFLVWTDDDVTELITQLAATLSTNNELKAAIDAVTINKYKET